MRLISDICLPQCLRVLLTSNLAPVPQLLQWLLGFQQATLLAVDGVGSLPQNAGIGTLEISHDGLPEFDNELQAERDKNM